MKRRNIFYIYIVIKFFYVPVSSSNFIQKKISIILISVYLHHFKSVEELFWRNNKNYFILIRKKMKDLQIL